MRIAPELDEVVTGDRGMLPGIAFVVEARCMVSAVTLMFAAVDALAALRRPIGQQDTTRMDFIAWVDRYLNPQRTLDCTAVDLYAARCGVLHTYSAESRLERQGEARRVIYQWRGGPAADAMHPMPPNALVISVEQLHEVLIAGVQEFLVDSEMDPHTQSNVEHHLPSLHCYIPWPNRPQ